MNCRVIMATQFFTSMLQSPVPSIAEMDSLYDLLRFGIDGVQLSEETSVGQYGLEVLKIIRGSLKASGRNLKGAGKRPGRVVWIMGPTSSGKTSLAQALTARLARSEVPVVHLDGDEIRDLYGPNLAFGPQDRLQVVSMLVHFARKAAQAGHNVVVSALTAYESAREYIRENLDGLTIVSLQCRIEECIRRDVKGLYAKALRGEIDTMVGINTPYDPPRHADLTLDTSSLSLEECLEGLTRYLIENRRIQLWSSCTAGSKA
jgi:adenylylsulfate kinase-like enzyme